MKGSCGHGSDEQPLSDDHVPLPADALLNQTGISTRLLTYDPAALQKPRIQRTVHSDGPGKKSAFDGHLRPRRTNPHPTITVVITAANCDEYPAISPARGSA